MKKSDHALFKQTPLATKQICNTPIKKDHNDTGNEKEESRSSNNILAILEHKIKETAATLGIILEHKMVFHL